MKSKLAQGEDDRHLQYVAVLLGVFAGLRSAEVCGLRVADIDFVRGVVSPRVQYGDTPLKSAASLGDVPVPFSLVAEFSAHSAQHTGEGGEFIVNGGRAAVAPHIGA